MTIYANLTVRPLGAWPWPETSDWNRKGPRSFRSAWTTTVAELQRELGMLGVSQGVLEVDVHSDRDVRRDGWVREDAKVKSPRVVLRFAHPEQGALVYKCDRYTDWKANVRGIALGLGALRAVERYGITSSSEQFAGFRELPSTTGPTMTSTRAAEVLAGSSDRSVIEKMLRDVEAAKAAARGAVKVAHPDVGGTSEQFQTVQMARKVLSAHHGQAI